jgi:hypothetical protein
MVAKCTTACTIQHAITICRCVHKKRSQRLADNDCSAFPPQPLENQPVNSDIYAGEWIVRSNMPIRAPTFTVKEDRNFLQQFVSVHAEYVPKKFRRIQHETIG